MMNKMLSSIIVFLAIFIVTGCATRALVPNAENVKVIPDNNYDAIKSCRFLGQISGRNIHGESAAFTSDTYLETDDIYFLKNEAAKLNANVVTFKQHEIISEPHRSPNPRRSHYTETKHNIQANAYICPSDIQQKLSRWELERHYM